MGAYREQRLNSLMETVATNEEFRDLWYLIEFEEALEELNKKSTLVHLLWALGWHA